MTIAHARYLLCNYLVPIAQGMQSVMYIHYCNRAELARCVETTVCHNCAQQTGTIDTCQGANAHWAMPHLSGRRSSLLKRVRFGYGSLTNLFSTTLSIQANSRVLTLTVSAKRKTVHSSYRDVTTKSERVIAHVIGSNLLWRLDVTTKSERVIAHVIGSNLLWAHGCFTRANGDLRNHCAFTYVNAPNRA